MYQILFLLILAFVAVAAVWVLVQARRQAREHGTSAVEEVVGICSVALERSSQKEVRKEQIIEILNTTHGAGNHELREVLGVSRQAIVKYASELEAEGRIRQIGETGRGVTYEKIK